MAHHDHKHGESGRHTAGENTASSGRKFHKDWRVWLAFGMMFTAIIAYVLTLDDSVVPFFWRPGP